MIYIYENRKYREESAFFACIQTVRVYMSFIDGQRNITDDR